MKNITFEDSKIIPSKYRTRIKEIIEPDVDELNVNFNDLEQFNQYLNTDLNMGSFRLIQGVQPNEWAS